MLTALLLKSRILRLFLCPYNSKHHCSCQDFAARTISKFRQPDILYALFAFRNRACHIVVQPHDDLAEADLASSMIVPVIEIAFDVVGTSFHKLLLKVSSPCL